MVDLTAGKSKVSRPRRGGVRRGTRPAAIRECEELLQRGGPAPDGLMLAVAGMPRFEVRQRAVVFSTGNGLVACPLVGWWQGLYRVVYDAERRAFTVAATMPVGTWWPSTAPSGDG